MRKSTPIMFLILCCTASFYLGGLAVRRFDNEKIKTMPKPAMEALIVDILKKNEAQAVVVFRRPENKIWVNWVLLSEIGALDTLDSAKSAIRSTVPLLPEKK